MESNWRIDLSMELQNEYEHFRQLSNLPNDRFMAALFEFLSSRPGQPRMSEQHLATAMKVEENFERALELQEHAQKMESDVWHINDARNTDRARFRKFLVGFVMAVYASAKHPENRGKLPPGPKKPSESI